MPDGDAGIEPRFLNRLRTDSWGIPDDPEPTAETGSWGQPRGPAHMAPGPPVDPDPGYEPRHLDPGYEDVPRGTSDPVVDMADAVLVLSRLVPTPIKDDVVAKWDRLRAWIGSLIAENRDLLGRVIHVEASLPPPPPPPGSVIRGTVDELAAGVGTMDPRWTRPAPPARLVKLGDDVLWVDPAEIAALRAASGLAGSGTYFWLCGCSDPLLTSLTPDELLDLIARAP